jgi:hypothetical protein
MLQGEKAVGENYDRNCNVLRGNDPVARAPVKFDCDAERCARALNESLSGAAMGDYQRERDAYALPMYDFTYQLAALAPPTPRGVSCSLRSTAIRTPWTPLRK